MKHTLREEDRAIVVAFEGDMDLDNSPMARKVILDVIAKGRPVVVDLAQVGYIDSSGVASLVEGLQAARKKGHGFALCALSEAAQRVLSLARLDKVFDIHRTVQEGLARIS